MLDWFKQFSASTAYITHPLCQAHTMGEGHPESPERLIAIEESLKKSKLFNKLRHIKAPEVSDIQLARVHPSRYLHRLASLTPHTGTIKVDSDTAMNNSTLIAARHASGAVVKAVNLVMRGKVHNAFCAIRPPGHHAQSEKAMGFCFINNVAVGAMHAIAEHALRRVAIVDFDVHHGNGTEEIFKDDDRIMLLSAFEHPFFPYSGDKPTGSNAHIINTPLPANTDGTSYRQMVTEIWLPHLEQFRPELIIISAGFDAHQDDDMAYFSLSDDDFSWISKQLIDAATRLCKGKIVSVLEGGYHTQSLSRLVTEHIRQLLEA